MVCLPSAPLDPKLSSSRAGGLCSYPNVHSTVPPVTLPPPSLARSGFSIIFGPCNIYILNLQILNLTVENMNLQHTPENQNLWQRWINLSHGIQHVLLCGWDPPVSCLHIPRLFVSIVLNYRPRRQHSRLRGEKSHTKLSVLGSSPASTPRTTMQPNARLLAPRNGLIFKNICLGPLYTDKLRDLSRRIFKSEWYGKNLSG